ncbi:hypothetical protein HPSNT_03920 [Helicobacter pylori SNT49]|uniref:Uncharacterized protein n=6 Tax=Helicobacter pylori TaxID=210 RepID=E8QFQ1_HELP7|nr:hypothetical protein HPSH_03040 [Helicobacter pylori Shi470]ADO03968.1 hypothetical protein HPCU_04040 [Helicobacter pylori Cuz20]ADU79813.1 hypothetical protein HPIN_02835 [Helicobacter pylori India7]AEN15364.1 hypothetical protein HPPN120_03745 [Helicobacter pylori Puno120]AEN16934.1 hypothetical protein HPSNT_03920 [Helicobacter pylori SNT49]AFH97875.1 hypothetical protein HPSH417_03665 [Helicobacter pylori Shi417]AFH99470.1 hypothetical protein HPSH169_03890 [Helicobacter pylori Shi169
MWFFALNKRKNSIIFARYFHFNKEQKC